MTHEQERIAALIDIEKRIKALEKNAEETGSIIANIIMMEV